MTAADAPTDVERARAAEREILSRRPEHAVEPTLGRIAELAGLLGDPQRGYPIIHVTGTNGKTSTARMIETLLRARGLRTGLFTSPHLSSIRERIALDGQPLSPAAFAAAHDDVAPYVAMVDGRAPLRLSFFEVLTAMAFAAFADAPVDVAVVEVGLGGTWDATNIADGAVAVITPVAIDHTAYLGDTVEEIAADKAGIIKPGAVAVLARQQDAAAEPLLRRAAEVGASVLREDADFGVVRRELAVGGQLLSFRAPGGDYEDVILPLFGGHQAGNAACALAAVEAFARVGALGPAPADGADAADSPGLPPAEVTGGRPPAADGGRLDPVLVREAFAAVTSPGRLEVVRRGPTVLVDSAHNPAGMATSLAAVAEAFSFPELVAVLAVSEDKDVPGILDEMEPSVSAVVATRNSSPRCMDPAALEDLAAAALGPERVRAAARLDEAIDLAVGLADEAAAVSGPGAAGVLVTGSVVTAGDARVLLRAGGEDSPA